MLMILRVIINQILHILNQIQTNLKNLGLHIKIKQQVLVHLRIIHQKVKPIFDQIQIELLRGFLKRQRVRNMLEFRVVQVLIISNIQKHKVTETGHRWRTRIPS